MAKKKSCLCGVTTFLQFSVFFTRWRSPSRRYKSILVDVLVLSFYCFCDFKSLLLDHLIINSQKIKAIRRLQKVASEKFYFKRHVRYVK
jgi:hypothetical protein